MDQNEVEVGKINWVKYEGVTEGMEALTKIRYKDKGGVEDLKKAMHDLQHLIEVELGQGHVSDFQKMEKKADAVRCTCTPRSSLVQNWRPCPLHEPEASARVACDV